MCSKFSSSLLDLFEWGPMPWFQGGTRINDTCFFAGKINTDKLCALGDGYKAAQAARGYREGGYEDWSLPSRCELKEMYKQREVINRTSVTRGGSALANTCQNPCHGIHRYWSSSEYSMSFAWIIYFDNGASYCDAAKENMCRVRPVRIFNY